MIRSRKDLWSITLAGCCIAAFLLVCSVSISQRITGEFSYLDKSYTAQQVGAALGLFRLQEQRMIELAVSRPMHLRLQQWLKEQPASAWTNAVPEAMARTAGIELGAVFTKDGTLVIGFDWQNGAPRILSSNDPLVQSLRGRVIDLSVRTSTAFAEVDGRAMFFVFSSVGRFELPGSETADAYLAIGRSLSQSQHPIAEGAPYQIRFSPAKSFVWPNDLDLIRNPAGLARSNFSRSAGGTNDTTRLGSARGGPSRSPLRRRFEAAGIWTLADLLFETEFFADPIPLPDKTGGMTTRILGKLPGRDGISAMIVELLVPREVSNSVNRSIAIVRMATLGAAILILLFTFAVVREVRKRRNAEMELLVSVSELREANLRKDQLLSIVAHDVRAPLTGVVNLSNLMLKKPSGFTPEEIRGFATEIQTVSKNLTQVLENLLCWARLKTGSLPYVPLPIDLKKVVYQVLALFQPLANARRITLTSALPDSLSLTTDEEMLRTILRNLVSNAIRFNRDGGEVRIAAERQADLIEVTVSDTGLGLAENVVNNLMNQTIGRDETRPNGKSSGFGLQLVKELTHRLGGEIEIHTRHGAGTKFSVHIPDRSGPPDHSRIARDLAVMNS